MKKIGKILLIGLLSLVTIIGLILFFILHKVDRQPYFKTAYYQQTKTRLDSTLASLTAEKGQLKAGLSRISITPQIGLSSDAPAMGAFATVPLAGYGGRASDATGVHDSIFARAVAIQVLGKPIVFIGTDLLIMPPAVADSVQLILQQENGISRDQLYFGATHSHSSAGACSAGFVGEQFGGKFQAAYVSWLSRQLSQVIRTAIKDLQPSSIGFDQFKAADYVRNRMIGETGRLNDIFTFVSIVQHTGKKAVLGAFAAHATTLGESNLEFSGDYPGYWERKLEKEAVDLAIFFAGTVGSHSYRSQGEGFEKARYIGEALADSVIVHLNQVTRKDSVSFTHFSSVIDIPKMQIRVTKNLRLSASIGNKLIPGTHDPAIQAMKIDDFIWMTLPCELSGEYAIDLKNALALRGYRSIFSSFNGAYLGYIVLPKYYQHDNYESFLMGWYGPNMGDYLMELLFSSCRALTGERL